MELKPTLALLAGGALGAWGRFLLSSQVERVFGDKLAWGTLAVNLLGCLALGFLAARWELAAPSEAWRRFAAVGALGAFTTYSTFAFETTSYLRAGVLWAGFAHITLHVVLGIAAVFLGVWLARSL